MATPIPLSPPASVKSRKYEPPEDLDCISSDPDVALKVVEFRKEHPCPHWDEPHYLSNELQIFKDRDIIIKNYHGEVIAGLYSKIEPPISSVYRWMGLVFEPCDGWLLRSIPDGEFFDRGSQAVMGKGEYEVLRSDFTGIELQQLERRHKSFLLRPDSQTRTPPSEIDLHFARQVMHRDPQTMVAGWEIPSMLDDEELEQLRELYGSIDWARIFPTSRLDEWLLRLPVCDRNDEAKVRQHIARLSSAENGISIPHYFHLDFDQFKLGVDVEDNYRIYHFIEYFNNPPKDRRAYRLHLDHIEELSQHPSKELLQEHFKICLLRFFSGKEDIEQANGDFHAYAMNHRHSSLNLSQSCWLKGGGKEILELHLARSLFSTIISPDEASLRESNRWSKSRVEELEAIQTPTEEQEWPDHFNELHHHITEVINWDPSMWRNDGNGHVSLKFSTIELIYESEDTCNALASKTFPDLSPGTPVPMMRIFPDGGYEYFNNTPPYSVLPNES